MNNKVEQIAKKIKPFLKPFRVEYVGLFGSVARGQAKKNSDIDLLVKFKSAPGLVDYIKLQDSLTKVLGRKVDLVSTGSVTPQLRPYIYRDLVTVYENR